MANLSVPTAGGSLRSFLVLSLGLLLFVLLSLGARGAERGYLLRWIAPPEPDVVPSGGEAPLTQ
jgi:hypothetical protein